MMSSEGAPPHPSVSETDCLGRVRVGLAEVLIVEGKMKWGRMVNTTGNRVHQTSGQYNRSNGPFPRMTVEDIYELEREWCHEENVEIPVLLKELIECGEYKGNIDKISKHCFAIDWAEMQRLENDNRSTESSRPSRASGSPVKPGEDAIEKRRAELAKKDKTKLFGQYTNWVNLVKEWFRKAQTPKPDQTPKPGDKKRKQGPWDKSKARILELETENKSLKKAIITLRRGSDTYSNASNDTISQGKIQESIAEVAYLKQKLTTTNASQREMEQERDNETSKVADLRIEMKSMKSQHEREKTHMTEMFDKQVQLADMTGYVRGMKEGNVSDRVANNNTPASRDLAIM